ncbi:MAG: hypothetical protein LBB12_00460 [Holosporaceae bacterium]|nr:hypothetical protein [Holosporaceae bacterium]
MKDALYQALPDGQWLIADGIWYKNNLIKKDGQFPEMQNKKFSRISAMESTISNENSTAQKNKNLLKSQLK